MGKENARQIMVDICIHSCTSIHIYLLFFLRLLFLPSHGPKLAATIGCRYFGTMQSLKMIGSGN